MAAAGQTVPADQLTGLHRHGKRGGPRAGCFKILTRKYYGKKDPFRSREFRQPRWMELLAVLLFTVSGLGEGKSINVVLGGLPKAVTLAFVGWPGWNFSSGAILTG